MEQKEKNKPSLFLLITFWAQVGVFAAMIGPIIIPSFGQYLSPYFLIIMGSVLMLGVVLMFLTWKEKIEGALKKFLMLTGVSATGFIISVLLHNFFYALNMITGHITILKYLTEGLHAMFFFLSIPIFPLTFLVGVSGSIVKFFSRKKR